MSQIKWSASKFERQMIQKIARRAVELISGYEFLDAMMDIEATHCNGCALNFDRLLRADEFNFAHDISGIRRHLDRRSGHLMNCFVPRTAL